MSGELKTLDSELGVVKRAAALMPAMKCFIEDIRRCESLLSLAQITNASNLVPGTPNYVSHMLHKLNYQHNICAGRVGMMAGWRYQVQALVHEACLLKNDNVWGLPKQFSPACLKNETTKERAYQVLAVRHEARVHCVVVLEVYRGSVMKKRDENAPGKKRQQFQNN